MGSKPYRSFNVGSLGQSDYIHTHEKRNVHLFLKYRKNTFFDSETGLSDPRGSVDWKLIFGSFCFGLGWGIGGLCPGPFLLLIPLNSLKIPVFWGVPFIVGMKISQLINNKKPALEAKTKTS